MRLKVEKDFRLYSLFQVNSEIFYCNTRGPFNGNKYIAEALEFPLKKRWTTKAPKGGFAFGSVGFENVIYSLIGSKKGIVAINAETGEYVWQELDNYKRDGKGFLWGFSPKYLVTRCYDRKGYYLECLDAKTGKSTGLTWRGNMDVYGQLGDEFGFGLSRDSDKIAPNTLHLVDVSNLSQDRRIIWDRMCSSVWTLPGEKFWLGMHIQDDGFPAAAAIDTLTGDIQYTVPPALPLCSAGGYWMAGPTGFSTTVHSEGKCVCAVEEKTGKVLWSLEYSFAERRLPRTISCGVIHPVKKCMVMGLGPFMSDQGKVPHSIECRDLPTGKILWRQELEEGLVDEPYPPVQWMIVTGDIIWTMEHLLANKNDTSTYPPKIKKRLTARSIETGEILWKKMESAYSAIIVEGKLILNTGASMKCYGSA